jgi:hypothetical protein
MMKRLLYILYIPIFILLIFSCKNNEDVSIFDKTPDQRVAEAIGNLKNDLTSPEFGWKLKYKPVPDAGSFYVLLNFKDNNQLIIQSDLGARGGKFFQDTLTYRIDSSLGLQLVFETYSMFSFLFEQGSATFEAEYEFLYVGKNDDGSLVFKSKSDVTTPTTVLTFEEASSNDVNLLGTTVSSNLNLMSKDLDIIASSLSVTYQNKDLILYLSLDDITRTAGIPTASKKSNTAITADVSFTSGYFLKGDSIVFETPLTGTYLGINLNITSIKLNTLSNSQINICSGSIPTHAYTGITSAGDPIVLETTLFNASGATFAKQSTFFVGLLSDVRHNGVNVMSDNQADLPGVRLVELYYNYNIGGSSGFYGIGFFFQNLDNSYTYALRQFAPVLNDNNLIFNLQSKVSVFGNTSPDADVNNIIPYIDGLAQGDNTFVFRLSNGFYEFYNPCSGWDYILQPY